MPGSVSLRDLITHMSTRCCESLSYPSIADAVNVANSNADLLASLCCENNVLVINTWRLARRGRQEWRRRVGEATRPLAYAPHY